MIGQGSLGLVHMNWGSWAILSVVQAQFDTCLTFVIQANGQGFLGALSLTKLSRTQLQRTCLFIIIHFIIIILFSSLSEFDW